MILDLPTGTVTLLFTDIEGSTRLLQQLGERYASVLAECRQLMRAAFAQWNGREVETQGDAFFMVFARATDAIAAAVTIQRTLAAHPWPEGAVVRVRIGLHTGEPRLGPEGYIGLDVHQASRIMTAGHGGQILLSHTTRDLVEDALPSGVRLLDLGEHRLKDLRRPSHLFQLLIADVPSEFPPLKTLDSRPHNLPILPTTFIGREKEVIAIRQLLSRQDVRLVTLTGPGGVGKTRLGLQVVAELADHFADGVFFVPLVPLSNPELVVPTIAQTLSINESGDQSLLSLLKTVLQDKQLLLLLDNFEHVVDAALIVAELLTACPRLKVLATSRVVLHVRAEREFPVPPLAVPNLKRLPDPVILSQYEAVALFIQRALAVKSDFQVTNINAPAVAGICARLDGLPLAIELAAARSKYFPPQTLLARLEQGLAVLAGGARDLPPRQQTLRGTLAWSYELLSSKEQQLFRRLAVFVDGCTWEAAAAVCSSADQLEGEILEGIASLLDKSLLRQEEQEQRQDEARLWMLQTLREFGLECLTSAGEMEMIRNVHAAYYLSLAEEANSHLLGTEQAIWQDHLEREHENLRAALSWLLTSARRGRFIVPTADVSTARSAEQAFRLCNALFRFWKRRGYLSEGRGFLEQVLAIREGVAAPILARALYAASELAWAQDDYDRAEALCEESLALCRELADKAGMASSLFLLGCVSSWFRSDYSAAYSQLEEAGTLYQELGDTWGKACCLKEQARVSTSQGIYDQAEAQLEESLRLCRAMGATGLTGEMLYNLARALFLSQHDSARAYVLAEQSLALLKEVGNRQDSAYLLNLLGQIRFVRGELNNARTLLEESLATFKELGDRWGASEALIALAHVVVSQGDHTLAHNLYHKCLAIQREIHVRELIAACLEGLAELTLGTRLIAPPKEGGEDNEGTPINSFASERAREAVRFLGAAEALREAINAPIPLVYRTDYDQAVTAACTALGEKSFATAWTEGRVLSLERTITDALSTVG